MEPAPFDLTQPDIPSASFVGSWADYGFSVLLVVIVYLLIKGRIRFTHTRWLIVGVSLFLGVRYLIWRAAYTLYTEDSLGAGISLILFAAEIYGYFSLLLYYLQVANPTDRSPRPPRGETPPRVDIFITTLNESPDLLFRTLVACKALEYRSDRKRVFVLDDGKRREIERLALRLDCGYLAREDREHAKAGNLNHGLSRSDGDLILVLDCDHVPVRSFLSDTVGFFEDPKVAVVQTPHYFYNPDTFQRNLRLERQIANEQDLFFRIIQPGRDGHNASFFAGSGGVFRRSALEAIGGFQVLTLTEDLHTTMVLHAKGYRSVYLNKVLAAGLSPESYRSYIKQRQRWTRGGLQVFLLDNPLWRRGLTVMQRIHYFGSIYYFFHGFPRVIYLAAPLVYLLSGYPPLVAKLPVLMNYFVPYYLTALMAFNLTSKGFRNPFWSDVYETAMSFFISWSALETIFTPRKTRFEVTPKGVRFEKAQLAFSFVTPHLVLAALLIGGMGLGIKQLLDRTGNLDAILLSLFWASYNLLILVAAIGVARERPQKRTVPRLARRIPCELTFNGSRVLGTTTDLSETGLSMDLKKAVLLPPVVNVRLISDFGETTEIKAEVIRNDSPPFSRSTVGLRFLNLSDALHQSLVRQMYSSPNSWLEVHRSSPTTWRSLGYIVTAIGRVFMKGRVLRRFSARVPKHLSCGVLVGDLLFRGVTENIGNTGMSIRFLNGTTMPEDKEVLVYLYDLDRIVFSIRASVVRQRRDPKSGTLCGVRFLERKDLELSSLV